MKKEIKFRVWNKQDKIMYQPHAISDELLHRDDLELMQFTSLKDKNGREIYSGDLLKYEHSKKSFEVKWADEGFWGFDGSCLGKVLRELKLEIVGNIES